MGDVYKGSNAGIVYGVRSDIINQCKKDTKMDMGVKEDKPQTKKIKKSWLFEDSRNIYRIGLSPDNNDIFVTILLKNVTGVLPTSIKLSVDVIDDLVDALTKIKSML